MSKRYIDPHILFNGISIDIPSHLHLPLVEYVDEGKVPSIFIRAVLSNDLRRSVQYVGKDRLSILVPLVKWLECAVPIQCWGEGEKISRWINHQGLREVDVNVKKT